MSADYAPGTVAIATVRGVEGVRVFRTFSSKSGTDGVWRHASVKGFFASHPEKVADVRPLVVLDLADAPGEGFFEAITGLRETQSNTARWVADQIEAQTKPRRIPEPGLWGVVEAAKHEGGYPWQWVHHPKDIWLNSEGDSAPWRHLIDPVLIREGVTS